MTAFADLSEIINRMTGGNSGNPEALFTWIDNRIDAAAANATVAGRWTSLWQYNSSIGGSGVIPTAADNPTNATRGSLMHANASGGREKWLLGNGVVCSAAGALMLYDRLLHCGDLSGIVTTAQTVGGSLTRNIAGHGNQIWVEIYAIVGATSRTITASYTNQDGVSGQTTKPVLFGGTGYREPQRLIVLPLQDTDTGVQSVESVTISATTGTAGNFGVTIAKPIALGLIPGTGTGFWRDYLTGLPNLPKIADDSCLALAFMANSTAAPQVMFAAGLVER